MSAALAALSLSYTADGDTRIESYGRGDRTRTCDLYVPNVALYQAELHPE